MGQAKRSTTLRAVPADPLGDLEVISVIGSDIVGTMIATLERLQAELQALRGDIAELRGEAARAQDRMLARAGA